MRDVVVGAVCARGRIGFVTVGRAGARPPLFRCLSHVGCRGDWRARPCFLSLVSRGARELLSAATRALYCFPMRVFSVESADGDHMAWSVCGAYDGMVSSAFRAVSTGGGSSHGALK